MEEYKSLGTSLARLLLLCRSSAAFYHPADRSRWIAEFLRHTNVDVCVYDTFGLHVSSLHKLIVDYCTNAVSTSRFCETAFDVIEKLKVDGNDTDTNARGLCDPKWWVVALGHLRRVGCCAAGTLSCSTVFNSRYDDLRIDFERVYSLDALSGVSPVTGHRGPLVTANSALRFITRVGFLNKADTTGQVPPRLKLYMYGSNLIAWDNRLPDGLVHDDRFDPATTYRRLLIDADELRNVMERLTSTTTVEGETTTAAASVCRPKFLSLSSHDIHLHFTFVLNATHYSGGVFYLAANEFCDSDLSYKREATLGRCQCRHSVMSWRLCVCITPLENGGGNSDDHMAKTVLCLRDVATRVLYAIDSAVDGHESVTGFLALPTPSYDEWSSDPAARMKPCALHSLLRDLAVDYDWVYTRSSVDETVRDLLIHGGQVVVVHRPVAQSVPSADIILGPTAYTNYMTFEDTLKRHVAVRLKTMVSAGAVASRENSLNFQEDPLYVVYRAGDSALKTHTPVDHAATASLLQTTFRAPSLVHIEYDAITAMGFRPRPLQPWPSNTFVHVDETSRRDCTVICTVPIVFTDETSPNVTEHRDQTFRVLYTPTAAGDSLLDATRLNKPDVVAAHHTYRERTVPLHDYWPSTYAVRVAFVGDLMPTLSLVEFVMFVTDSQTHVPLTYEGLYRLSVDSLRDPVAGPLPPTVLYTLQRMILANSK